MRSIRIDTPQLKQPLRWDAANGDIPCVWCGQPLADDAPIAFATFWVPRQANPAQTQQLLAVGHWDCRTRAETLGLEVQQQRLLAEPTTEEE